MRILIATGIYPPRAGGPAYYAKSLKEELEKIGHAVIVRTFTVERFLPTGVRHLVYFVKTLPMYLWADATLVFDTMSVGVPVALMRRFFGGTAIVRVGGDFLWEQYVERTGEKILLSHFYLEPRMFTKKERLIRRMTKWMLSQMSHIVFSTDYERCIWLSPYDIREEKTTIIENAYAVSPEIRPTEATMTFASFCRPLVLKNIDVLKEAFGALQKRYPHIRLDIAYDVPHDEVMRRVGSAYAVVVPSVSEVSPNLVLEALACGKPVVVSRENGLMDRIGDVVISIDPLSVDSLERGMETLLDPDTYAGYVEKIRALSFKRSYANVAEDFLNVLAED